MEANIRNRLRSATRSDGVASEDDSRRPQPPSATTLRGGSEPGSACRRPAAPKPVRHASTVDLTELFNTETEGEEMACGETPAEMYAKSMRWMDEMLADTQVDKEDAPPVFKEPTRSAPTEVTENSDDVVKEVTQSVEAPTGGEKLSYWGERLHS